MTKNTTYQGILPHFPPKISKEICDYVTDEVLATSRYLFTRRVGSFQYGYCTHCRKEYLTDGLKHNVKAQCKKCKSAVTIKSSGLGRKYLYDQAYFIYFEKSVENPKAIVARGIYVIRDYSGDYYKVDTKFDVRAMYLYEPGGSTMLRRGWGEWEERRRITCESKTSMKHVRCFISRNSIFSAAKGSAFEYSTWTSYDTDYMLLFFDMAAKYPCIEYLTKMGLRRVVEAKLYGRDTYRAINWRGKTLEKVLKVGKKELKEIRSCGLPIDPATFHYLHWSRRNGSDIGIADAYVLSGLVSSYYFTDIKKLVARSSVDRINKYILKQINKCSNYGTAPSVMIALRDYHKDCGELGIDLEQDHVFFPNDLHAAHQKTIRKVKIKADATLNVKIAARLEELSKYTFEHGELFIRPAASSIELFDEGKALEHCVGGYTARYAEGAINLFVIRRASEPDIPFYTIEARGQDVIQIRGKKNCNPTDEVAAFVEAFKAARLAKKSKKRKTKSKIALPA